MRFRLINATTFACLFLTSAAWGQIGAPLLGYVASTALSSAPSMESRPRPRSPPVWILSRISRAWPLLRRTITYW